MTKNRNLPGFRKRTFRLRFEDSYFNKGDILTSNTQGVPIKVIKVYKMNWWKRFILWLGFKVKWFEGVKVKEV